MTAYDAIIVGAGVVGCSIAHGLSRAGFKTVNIDRLPAPGYGSTSHSSAIIRPFYSHVTACAIAHQARVRWLEWADFLNLPLGSGLAEYRETGGIVLVREGEEDLYQNNLAALDDVDVAYQILSGEELEARLPHICLDSFGPPRPMQDADFGLPTGGRIGSGIYIPACGHVSDPQLATHNLFSAASAQGAGFRFNTELSALLRTADRVTGVALADGEEIHAPVVVNAAGPFSAGINELAGITRELKITTRAQRHEVAYLRAPQSHSQVDNGFVVDLDAGVYQRRDGADLMIGTTDPECDPVDSVDPHAYNDSFTEQWTLQVHRAAQRFPQLEIESKARGTVGLYDVSDDWIPIYDKTDLTGYYLAIGTSGNQFKNAPVIGDIMVAIITAEGSGIDHDLHPQSLVLPDLARSVDLSFYSRRREVQATHSVMA